MCHGYSQKDWPPFSCYLLTEQLLNLDRGCLTVYFGNTNIDNQKYMYFCQPPTLSPLVAKGCV